MKNNRVLLPLSVSLCLLASGQIAGQSGAGAASRTGYYRMKLVRILDEQGFGQPVEVARLLVPADWRAQGGVQWDSSQTRCPANIIKLQFRAMAPDGVAGIQLLPGYMWRATDDPMQQQILRQQAAARTGCDVGPVTGAVGFLKGSVVPHFRPSARIVASEGLPAVTQAKQVLLAQSYDSLLRAGYVRSYRADAGSVKLSYAENGRAIEDWLSATVISIATPMANSAALMQGQVNMSAANFTMASEGVLSTRAPAGQFDKKLFATIVASTRPNPQYQVAVAQFLTNMNNIARQGATDRARIWRDAGEAISSTITQSYQRQQAVQDRAAQQFSDTIRGVEKYVNPATGANVELAGGYANAWMNNRGEYLLSDSPGFDPGVTLKENWTELKKAR